MSNRFERMWKAWTPIAERFPAYALLGPGDSSFECLIERCPRHCCRIYNVSLGEWERTRMERESGLSPIEFLECEEGEPIALPLAQPYVLKREEGQCALLRPDMKCGQYAGRPNACRLYPHFVLFVSRESGRPMHGNLPAMDAAARAFLEDQDADLVPVLLRHLDCPGFGGAALGDAAWLDLFRETAQLQFGLLDPPEGSWTEDLASPV
ncbi:MAG: YkgJ family cysteine cluster protein [Dehalococcoidia bacterium]